MGEDVYGEISGLTSCLATQLLQNLVMAYLEIILHLFDRLGQWISKLDFGGIVIYHSERTELLDFRKSLAKAVNVADVCLECEDLH